MNKSKLLEILEPMMTGFKREIVDMRQAGATQADIDGMLDRFEEVYVSFDDEEAKLVMAVLREAAR